MSTKRWSIPFVLVILVSMLLAGCGPAPTPEVIKETVEVPVQETVEVPVQETVVVEQTVVVEATAEPAAEAVEIEFWHSWAPDGVQGRVLQRLFNEFNASQNEVFVTPIFVGEQRREKITAALAAGEPPDVAWIAGAGSAYYDAGQYVSMSRVWEVLDRSDFYPALLENMQFLGEDIAIPFENSNLAMYYNKDMLDAEGVEYPPGEVGGWTFPEFIEMAKIFSDAEQGKYGWDPLLDWDIQVHLFWAAGGEMFSPDFKTNLLCADTPEGDKQRELMAEALGYWIDMLFVSKITSTDVGDQGFVSEDMPFVISGPWAMPRYLEANPNLNIGVASLPAHPETRQVASYWYQKALALFKTNEEREEATLKFIKWFYSPEIHARWCAEASYLPITISAAEHPVWQEFVAEHPYAQVFLDQAPTMKRRPIGIPIGSLGGGMLHPVIYDGATPEEAIENYCLDAQALLDEFWSRR